MPATQVPVPLQVGIGSSVALAQLATPQAVPGPHLRQAPAPSQVPSFPQLVVAEAVQSLCTSVPDTAGAHCPTVPTPSQVMQVPVQAVSQQTPSTQKPLWQSPVPPQAVPFVSCGRHDPAEQKSPAAQSAFAPHEVRHDEALHTYAPHDTGATAA